MQFSCLWTLEQLTGQPKRKKDDANTVCLKFSPSKLAGLISSEEEDEEEEEEALLATVAR